MEEDRSRYRLEKIPLKKIWGPFRQEEWKKRHTQPRLGTSGVISYNFEQLIEDLKDPNFNIGDVYPAEKSINNEEDMTRKLNSFEPIRAIKFIPFISPERVWKARYTREHPEFEYYLRDGNHRCYSYLKLYGEDYELDVLVRDAVEAELVNLNK